ncbi:MAG: hypothetical protein JKY50_22605 [Oleispira sp.]|nr:hypothetical protein [Oleispira sp.]
MKTEQEKEVLLDKVEAQIKEILNENNLSISPLYDDGIACQLTHTEQYPSGDWSIFSREADFD